MNYDRTERIRRAAILVASLEETLAEQMLESLPRLEAAKILDEVDRLGELDPEEIQDVLEEFRSAGRRGRAAVDAVEFTYSAPKPPAAEPAESAGPTSDALADAARARSEADALLMAELLSHEHPQTIAAALSRLSHDQGSAVFAALPEALQADVLDRLANLEPGDEGAVLELESQLQRRVEQHRQRHERAAAATEMARRILVKTEPGQRDSLLARLSSRGAPEGAGTKSRTTAPELAATSQQATDLAIAVRVARQTAAPEASEGGGHFEAWASEPVVEAAKPQAGSMAITLEDRSRELELLDDRSLLEALRVADERTVHCALAASSETFLKRVVSKLPRKQASRLRQVVRSIGPTRLGELRWAQHELLRIARDCRPASAAAR